MTVIDVLWGGSMALLGGYTGLRYGYMLGVKSSRQTLDSSHDRP